MSKGKLDLIIRDENAIKDRLEEMAEFLENNPAIERAINNQVGLVAILQDMYEYITILAEELNES